MNYYDRSASRVLLRARITLHHIIKLQIALILFQRRGAAVALSLRSDALSQGTHVENIKYITILLLLRRREKEKWCAPPSDKIWSVIGRRRVLWKSIIFTSFHASRNTPESVRARESKKNALPREERCFIIFLSRACFNGNICIQIKRALLKNKQFVRRARWVIILVWICVFYLWDSPRGGVLLLPWSRCLILHYLNACSTRASARSQADTKPSANYAFRMPADEMALEFPAPRKVLVVALRIFVINLYSPVIHIGSGLVCFESVILSKHSRGERNMFFYYIFLNK